MRKRVTVIAGALSCAFCAVALANISLGERLPGTQLRAIEPSAATGRVAPVGQGEALSPGHDAAAYCQANLPPALVSLSVAEAPVTERNDKSIRELTSAADKGAPHGAWDTLGVTKQQYASEATEGLKHLVIPGTDIVCFRPQVLIRIEQGQHTVDIARELHPGTCSFAAVQAHERRHVEINKQAFRQAASRLESEMQARLDHKVFYGDAEHARKELDAEVRAVWFARLNALAAEGMKWHGEVDTPEEYARTSTVCGGEILRLMAEAESSR